MDNFNAIFFKTDILQNKLINEQCFSNNIKQISIYNPQLAATNYQLSIINSQLKKHGTQ
jgi:hypothetical protein